jgi:SecD/SecF fusion protein
MKILLPNLLAALNAVAVLGLLAGSGCAPKAPEHGTAFLVEADLSTLPPTRPPEAAVADTQRVLQKRLEKLGVRPFIEPVGTNRFQVKVPPVSEELKRAIRTLLARNGLIEFRMVHPEGEEMLKQGILPPGYEIKKETRSLPRGEKQLIPVLVEKKAVPNLSGKNISRSGVMRNNMNRPIIAFTFDADGAKVFGDLTSANIGKRLAILLDGELCSAPVIRSAITGGNCVIEGSFEEKEAFDLANILANPLETPLRVIEENSF